MITTEQLLEMQKNFLMAEQQKSLSYNGALYLLNKLITLSVKQDRDGVIDSNRIGLKK